MDKAAIEIRPIMNSCVEDVLGFKTCCGLKMFDQNLEIHVENKGDYPVTVHSYFDLEGDQETKRITTLTPPGPQRIEPGQIQAFYTSMDETLWNRSKSLIFYDTDGNKYKEGVRQEA